MFFQITTTHIQYCISLIPASLLFFRYQLQCSLTYPDLTYPDYSLHTVYKGSFRPQFSFFKTKSILYKPKSGLIYVFQIPTTYCIRFIPASLLFLYTNYVYIQYKPHSGLIFAFQIPTTYCISLSPASVFLFRCQLYIKYKPQSGLTFAFQIPTTF